MNEKFKMFFSFYIIIESYNLPAKTLIFLWKKPKEKGQKKQTIVKKNLLYLAPKINPILINSYVKSTLIYTIR